MLKIALTGTIGSGKSTVAELFREQGVSTLSVDDIARKLVEPQAKGWQALKKEFGNKYFNASLAVDRKRLRTVMFSDDVIREKINSLFFPLIKEVYEKECDNISGDLVIVEVPLLFESGWQDDFDASICVFADNEVCLDRIVARDNVTREEAEAVIATQMSLREKFHLADHVLTNTYDIVRVTKQVEKLLSILRNEYV